jgi:7-cyano-7-deazaguanine synthase in queuosine biosynthesis
MRYILWTGGFDSTYLLCKWARESDEEIQPLYVVFPVQEKSNVEREVDAIVRLINIIRAKPEIKAKINDPIYINKESLPEIEAYDNAWQKRKSGIPHTMWDCLGKVGYIYPGVAIGIEAPAPGYHPNDIGRFYQYLLDGGLDVSDDGVITPNVGNDEVLALFGRCTFPLLKTNTLDEWSAYQEWGYEDIAKLTRTCSTSFKDACGICNNCEIKWRYGDTFKFLFSETAQKRHKVKQFLERKNTDAVPWSEWFIDYIFNGMPIIKENGITQASKTIKAMEYFDKLLASDDLNSVETPTI